MVMDTVLSCQAGYVLMELGSNTHGIPTPQHRRAAATSRTPPFYTPHTQTTPPGGSKSPEAEAWHSVISTLASARSRRSSTSASGALCSSGSPGTPPTARQLFDGSPGTSSPASRRVLATSQRQQTHEQHAGPHTSTAQQLGVRLGKLRASAGAVLQQQQQQQQSFPAGSMCAKGGSSVSKQQRSISNRQLLEQQQHQQHQQPGTPLQQKLSSALNDVEELLKSIAQGQQAFLQHERQPYQQQLQCVSRGQQQQQQQQEERAATWAPAARGAEGRRHSTGSSGSSALHSKQLSALADSGGSGGSGSPAEGAGAPAAAAQPAADSSEPESPPLQTKGATATSSSSTSKAPPGSAGEEEQASPATPQAALPRVHTPGKPAADVAAQTSTPQLARSAAAVLSVSEAWRDESSASSCRWQELLDEWSASKPANAPPLPGEWSSVAAAKCAPLPAAAAAVALPRQVAAEAAPALNPPPPEDAVSFSQGITNDDAIPSPARLPAAASGSGHAAVLKECQAAPQSGGSVCSPGAVSVGGSEASELSLTSPTGKQRHPAVGCLAGDSTARRQLLAALDEADADEASSMSSSSKIAQGSSKWAAAASPAIASPPQEQQQQHQPAHAAGSERLNQLVASLMSLRQQLQQTRPSLQPLSQQQRRRRHPRRLHQLSRLEAGQAEQPLPLGGVLLSSSAAAARSAAAANSISALRLKLQESRAALEALTAQASAIAPAASLTTCRSRADGEAGGSSSAGVAVTQAPTHSRAHNSRPALLLRVGHAGHGAAPPWPAAAAAAAAATAADRANTSCAVPPSWRAGGGHHHGTHLMARWGAAATAFPASRVDPRPPPGAVVTLRGGGGAPRSPPQSGLATWLDSSPWQQQQQHHQQHSIAPPASAPSAGTLQRWAQEGSPREQLAAVAAAARQQQQQRSARLAGASSVGPGAFACSMAAIDAALSLPRHAACARSGGSCRSAAG